MPPKSALAATLAALAVGDLSLAETKQWHKKARDRMAHLSSRGSTGGAAEIEALSSQRARLAERLQQIRTAANSTVDTVAAQIANLAEQLRDANAVQLAATTDATQEPPAASPNLEAPAADLGASADDAKEPAVEPTAVDAVGEDTEDSGSTSSITESLIESLPPSIGDVEADGAEKVLDAVGAEPEKQPGQQGLPPNRLRKGRKWPAPKRDRKWRRWQRGRKKRARVLMNSLDDKCLSKRLHETMVEYWKDKKRVRVREMVDL